MSISKPCHILGHLHIVQYPTIRLLNTGIIAYPKMNKAPEEYRKQRFSEVKRPIINRKGNNSLILILCLEILLIKYTCNFNCSAQTVHKGAVKERKFLSQPLFFLPKILVYRKNAYTTPYPIISVFGAAMRLSLFAGFCCNVCIYYGR